MIPFTNSAKWLTMLCLLFMTAIPLFAQNTSQWERLGPFGGPVLNINKDGHDVFWAIGSEGLFRSDDDTQSWQLSVRLEGATRLATNDSIIVVGFRGGTITSSDYGLHWNTYYFDEHNGTPTYLTVIGDTLYMTANYSIPLSVGSKTSSLYPSGILRSTDMGRTWYSFALTNDHIKYIAIEKNGRFYAQTTDNNNLIYSDGGISWDTLGIAQEYGTLTSLITVADTAVFFGIENEELYRITGKTPTIIPVGSKFHISHLYTSEHRLFVDSGNSTLYWSEDLGKSWHDLTYPDVFIFDLTFSDGDLWLATTEMGLIRLSPDSDTWTRCNAGLSVLSVGNASQITVSPHDSIFVGLDNNFNHGIMRYEENGTWSSVGLDSVPITSIGFSQNGTLFAFSGYNLYIRSTIDYKWQTRYIPKLFPALPKSLFITQNGLLYIQYVWDKSTLYMSADQGRHWEYMYKDNFIEHLTADSYGQLYGTMNKVMVTSTDSGRTWKSLDDYSGNLQVESISKWSGDSLLVGTQYDGVYIVSKQGTNWSSLGNPGYSIGMTTADNNGYIFAYSFGKRKAYAWSIDNPGWRTITFPDLPLTSQLHTYFHKILIDNHHRLVVWSIDRDVYRSNVNTFILPINHEPSESIKKFKLRQNYPNPFNPTTTIRYELAKAGPVKLTVYNMLGQQVSVLVDSRQATGAHQIIFNASRLSSGVYFYRLKTGDNVSVKKMLLMK